MTSTTNQRPAGYFQAVRAIWDVTETAPGLPVPAVDKYSAVYHFTGIIHAEDARRAVAEAEAILRSALLVKFEPKKLTAKGVSYRILTGTLLPSGLRIELVALARHFDGSDAPADGDAPALVKVPVAA